MKKTQRNIPQNDGTIKYLVRLEDIEIAPDRVQQRQVDFLKELVDNGFYNGLLNCGSGRFERMLIYFSKTKNCWIAELESEEEEVLNYGK